MAALTGNSVASSYTGLLKTFSNGPLAVGLRQNVADGAGNPSTLFMAQDSAAFTGTLDLSGATVTGLPGGAPGLVNGTGVGSSLGSLKVADHLVTTPATSTSGGNIAIGDNARAEGTDNFGRGNVAIGANSLSNNERGVALGMGSQALGSRGVGIGENAKGNGARGVSIGQATSAGAFLAVAVGNYSNANHEGSICIGGYAANSNGNYSIQIGQGVSATTQGVAIGQGATSTATGAVALGAGMTAAWANATTVNQLQVANYASLNYADDTAAAAGGVPLGGIYHNAGALRIRIV